MNIAGVETLAVADVGGPGGMALAESIGHALGEHGHLTVVDRGAVSRLLLEQNLWGAHATAAG
ncbi:MAG: hypothetical protein EOO40_05185, partial [Deltaproteobacteria bacterium]